MESVEMQLNDDEYKIVMAYRHKDDLEALREALMRSLVLVTGRETIEPEMVRRICSDATAYDVLLTKCGFLPELEPAEDDGEDAPQVEEGEDTEA